MWYHQVNWEYGLLLAVGAVVGALIASRLAVAHGVAFVKWIIVVVILITSGEMFGLYDFKSIVSTFIN
jgi:uncharacterized membrane protein YfcA